MACVLSVCMGGGVLQPIHITRRVTVLLVPAACCCCYCLHHRTCEWLTCQGGGGRGEMPGLHVKTHVM
jgi:hypothetical protein